jgi:hypothetical protein
MSRRANPEQAIQKAVFQHIRARGVPGLVAFHVPNGGQRNPVEASIFKGLGVRAGVADIIAIHQGKIYALELKAEGGKATEAQIQFLGDVERAGAYTAIPRGLDAALATLESWGLLRPALRSIGDVLRRLDTNTPDPLASAKPPAQPGSAEALARDVMERS